MANRILLTVSALIKDNLRNRFVIFWIIIFPLLLTLLFSLVFGGFSSYFHVVVVVNGNDELAKFLNTTRIFEGVTSIPFEYALQHNYIYVNVNNNNFTLYTSQQNEIFIPSLEAIINEYLHQSLSSNVEFNVVKVSNFTYYDYLISGMLGIITLSNGILGVIGVSAGYYRDRLIERLATSPLKSYEWVLSLVIYVIIITIISMLVIIILGIIYGFIPLISLTFILVLVISTLFFSSLGTVIYGLTPKDKIFLSEVVANVLVFPLMFLSNAFFPSYVYPPIARVFIEYQPLSIIITDIRDLTIYNTLPNLLEIIVILILALVLLYISSYKLLRLREID
ncbi:ABC transporter [Sulfolobus sp. A20]|uniref:ABC transporter permease n=1 Tax=Saccharolobus sp. A20 TaxID=1891280 RepID=UPI0008461FCB|nr:ABC transporter permease [Sulfolobus sp. A20]TRM77346.1 ABC transporter permease [Sulfolobus sp. A20-N-F8]TRM79194.1 ABC transporter permease [Sulfolobus sp. B5]TRM88593.1 ABC transporter permease [Sulfolobus sp. C3]TRM94598.1 ABC transporter permease [Sulfolobus sp. A20-N-G8]TRN02977.1 ABC transporter permease [Sulfolobus sp. F1]TRN04234.1 ABC transporter permease [Sulfolobus sp. E1]